MWLLITSFEKYRNEEYFCLPAGLVKRKVFLRTLKLKTVWTCTKHILSSFSSGTDCHVVSQLWICEVQGWKFSLKAINTETIIYYFFLNCNLNVAKTSLLNLANFSTVSCFCLIHHLNLSKSTPRKHLNTQFFFVKARCSQNGGIFEVSYLCRLLLCPPPTTWTLPAPDTSSYEPSTSCASSDFLKNTHINGLMTCPGINGACLTEQRKEAVEEECNKDWIRVCLLQLNGGRLG